jgi:uncharacterized protein
MNALPANSRKLHIDKETGTMRSVTIRFVPALLSVGMLLIVACDTDPEEESRRTLLQQPLFAGGTAEQMYVDSLTGVRHFKDEWMKNDENAPLHPDDRERFEALEYYPVDPNMVFRTRLHRYDDPDRIMIGTTSGDEREAVRYGYVDFSVDGEPARLYAYKFTAYEGTDLESYIFIPFKDATSGDETYSGGRYMDVQEEMPGVVIVDFNDAYNPYCVYNDRYVCPIPPQENHLRVAIRAGEKDFVLE